MLRFLVALTALLCLGLAPAMAFAPHVGDRAAELTGRDVASRAMFKLSEQAGRWVLVDYWAST